MSIWKNLGRAIARALRAAGRALRRLARRGKDSATAAAETAAEIAEDAYEISLDVAHDALDVAEHVAAVPGALIGGVLGARPEQPGDVADAAIAADAGPVKAAPPAAAQAIADKRRPVDDLLDYAMGRRTAKEAGITEGQRLWVDDLQEDERLGLERYERRLLAAHMRGFTLIPGLQPPYNRAMIRARYAEVGMPLEVAMEELRHEARMQGTADWERARGNAKGADWIEEAMRKGSMRPKGPVPVPAAAHVHEAPAMRM